MLSERRENTHHLGVLEENKASPFTIGCICGLDGHI